MEKFTGYQELSSFLRDLNQLRSKNPDEAVRIINEAEAELDDFQIRYSDSLRSHGFFPKPIERSCN
jgi:hypothetical protein